MIGVETCPRCGGDLDILMLATNPPIPERRCGRCGWFWREEMQMPVRIPFKPNEREGGKLMHEEARQTAEKRYQEIGCQDCPLAKECREFGGQTKLKPLKEET